MTEKQLLSLKKEITTAEKELAELQGEQKAQLKALQSTYGCKSVEDVKKLLAKKQEELAKKQEELTELLTEIEEIHNS